MSRVFADLDPGLSGVSRRVSTAFASPAKAVMDSLPEVAGGGPLAVLSRFRVDFHACLTARADELADPERLSCHVCGRGKGQAQMIPGWPCSVIAAGHWREGDPAILIIFDRSAGCRPGGSRLVVV